METWYIYGIIAALLYGLSAVTAKYATSSNYIGLDIQTAAFLMLIGIGIVFLAYAFSGGMPSLTNNTTALSVGILAGALWAAGMVVTFFALKSGAEISKLAPLYNTNTLVAVTLGIVLLKELPAGTEKIKVIIGAILIVIGGILLS